MKTRFVIPLVATLLLGSAAAFADGHGRDRGWSDRGRDQGHWQQPRPRGYHNEWRPSPGWHHHGPAYRSYGHFPPYAHGRDGVTIILRGRLP
ncbi:MAG: hypothetical protein ABI794_06820 [Betaproteobacteria bacterium]